jgi:hypothetical protein
MNLDFVIKFFFLNKEESISIENLKIILGQTEVCLTKFHKINQ